MINKRAEIPQDSGDKFATGIKDRREQKALKKEEEDKHEVDPSSRQLKVIEYLRQNEKKIEQRGRAGMDHQFDKKHFKNTQNNQDDY